MDPCFLGDGASTGAGAQHLAAYRALDGGHVLFLLVEMITGRKPSDKFLERAQLFGMVILLSLMLYANGMDVIRALF